MENEAAIAAHHLVAAQLAPLQRRQATPARNFHRHRRAVLTAIKHKVRAAEFAGKQPGADLMAGGGTPGVQGIGAPGIQGRTSDDLSRQPLRVYFGRWICRHGVAAATNKRDDGLATRHKAATGDLSWPDARPASFATASRRARSTCVPAAVCDHAAGSEDRGPRLGRVSAPLWRRADGLARSGRPWRRTLDFARARRRSFRTRQGGGEPRPFGMRAGGLVESDGSRARPGWSCTIASPPPPSAKAASLQVSRVGERAALREFVARRSEAADRMPSDWRLTTG